MRATYDSFIFVYFIRLVFFFTFRLSLSAFMVKNVRTDIFKMDL